jgi:hypothetical protein
MLSGRFESIFFSFQNNLPFFTVCALLQIEYLVCAGIMFTLLPLFDLVYSVPGATFTAPFSSLGQTPEGA